MRKLCSPLALFSRNERQASEPCGSGPSAAEAPRRHDYEDHRLHLLSQSSIAGSSNLLDQEAHSITSSNLAESMLLVPSSSEELDVVGEGKKREFVEPSSFISPA